MNDPHGTTNRRALQESQYDYPYHWIANDDAGHWSCCRATPGAFAYLALLEEVRREVQLASPARILDFGCGDGRLAHLLARDGAPEVTGLDLSPSAIAFARSFPGPPGLRFECGAIEEMPAEPYDALVAMEVLEHVPEGQLDSIVGALRLRAAPDALLVVTVPTTNVPLSPKHERHYTVDLLNEHLQGAFVLRSCRYVNRLSTLGRTLDRLAANRLFALRHPGLLRWATDAYRRRATAASPGDGANLLAVYEPAL